MAYYMYHLRLLIGALALVGGALPAAAGAPTDSAPLVAVPESLALMEYAPVADMHKPLRRLRLAEREAERYLHSGWNNIGRDRETGHAYRWTRDRTAAIYVPVAQPKRMVLRFAACAPQIEGRLPVQEVRILWNGQECATTVFNAEEKEVEITVPADVQRFGPNLLSLETHYWVISETIPGAPTALQVGLRCRDFRFATKTPEIWPLGKPAVVEDGVLHQRPGTVLTFFCLLPEKAAFRAKGHFALEGDVLGELPPGQVVVAVTPADGRQTLLFQQKVGDLIEGAGFDVESDLAQYAGQVAALTLSFPLASVSADVDAAIAESCRLDWTELRVLGVRQAVAPTPALNTPLDHLRGRHNLLIVLFDTLRADFTEAYRGPDAAKTPQVARLAQAGTTFVNTYSNSSWTRASVSSILTGLTPQSHGILTLNDPMLPSMPYLPALLQQHGYTTAAILNMANIDPNMGFGRGFDNVCRLYEDRYQGALDSFTTPDQSVEFVWNKYIQPFLRSGEDKPFFIYLHEMDPHAPWNAPEAYEEMYDFGYQGKLDCESEIVTLLRRNAMPLTPLDVEHLKATYKAEITFMDGYLGALMDKLRSAGLLENTAVLFISDHGEELYEHGCIGHYWHHYNEALRVPMIWALPGRIPSGKRPHALAQLLDVPPTLLDLVGAEVPRGMQGRSLLPFFVLPDTLTLPVPCFGRVRVQHYDSLLLKNWKLLKRLGGDLLTGRQPVYSLYDLSTDPGERRDWWSTHLIEAKTLLQMLAMESFEGDRRVNAFRAAAPSSPATAPELSKEVREDLRALGYLD